MAQLFSTGPAHIFVAPAGIVQYLGTCEKAPQIVVDPVYEPVFNDAGGSSVPLDEMYQGQTGVVSTVLNRWNESVLQAIRSIPEPIGNAPGRNIFGDLAFFMGQEDGTYPVYVQFPYSIKATMVGMPAGYRFWAGKNIGPFQVMPGTTALRKQVIFGCTRHWGTNPLTEPAVPRNAPLVGFTLYDHNLADIAGVALN